MSGSDVSYQKPPRQSQWKKRQSGNPSGTHKAARRSTVELIDAILRRKVTLEVAGDTIQMTTLKGIVLRLWGKSLSGDKRATTVLLRFQKLDPPEIVEGQFIVRGGLRNFDPALTGKDL